MGREEVAEMKNEMTSFFEAVRLCLLVLFLVVVVPGFFTVYLILGICAGARRVHGAYSTPSAPDGHRGHLCIQAEVALAGILSPGHGFS
jgi:hypothetical protein